MIELEGVDAALDQAAALLDRAPLAAVPVSMSGTSRRAGITYDIEGEAGAIITRSPARGQAHGGGAWNRS